LSSSLAMVLSLARARLHGSMAKTGTVKLSVMQQSGLRPFNQTSHD
jgi:hypothetical protein